MGALIIQKILEFFKKIDIKTTSIIILIITSLFFGYKWYFNDNNKTLIKELHDQNAKIDAERKVIAHQLDSLKKENQKLTADKNTIEEKIIKINDLIDQYKKEGIKSKADLNNFKKSMDKINLEIENLIKNPSNKQDDELLISLRNHFKEREKIYNKK